MRSTSPCPNPLQASVAGGAAIGVKNEKLSPQKLIKNRFLVQGEIGQGGYGAVSKALDKLTGDLVAIKFNKKAKNFKLECVVMEAINKFKFPGFPRLISYGVTDTQNYIVSELLGPTLKQILSD